eukprot:scaffold1152_cov174-Skeletonema_marinoi.AAC.9
MSDNANAQHTASKTGSEEDLLHNMQHTTEQHHEHGQDRSGETAPAASTDTDLPFLRASPNLSILHHSLLFLF